MNPIDKTINGKINLGQDINLQESKIVDTRKGIVEVVFIKPGRSKRGNYYTKEVLKDAIQLFEGVKMYLDHQDPKDVNTKARSIKDWVATLKDVRQLEDGSLAGYAHPRSPEWREKVLEADREGYLNEMGLSIDAFGKARQELIEGKPCNFIERMVVARSVDVIPEASAGGALNRVVESDSGKEEVVMDPFKDLTIDQLREVRPDLVELLESEVAAGVEAATEEELAGIQEGHVAAIDALNQENEDALAQLQESFNQELEARDEHLANLSESVNQMIEDDEDEELTELIESELEEVPDFMLSFMEGMSNTVEELKATVEAQNMQMAEYHELIQEQTSHIDDLHDGLGIVVTQQNALDLLVESGLPEVSVEKLLPQCINQPVDDIVALIESEIEYLKNFDATGTIFGAGGEDEEASDDDIYDVACQESANRVDAMLGIKPNENVDELEKVDFRAAGFDSEDDYNRFCG